MAKSDPTSALSDREDRFVECYLLHLNGNRAAEESGYTSTGAGAAQLRKPHVAKAIRERMDVIRRENKGLRLEVLRVLAAQLMADPADICNPDGTVKPLGEIPLEARLAIQDVSYKKWGKQPADDEESDESSGGIVSRVKLASKVAVAKTLGVFIGMATPEDIDQDADQRERVKSAGQDLKAKFADIRKEQLAGDARAAKAAK